MLFHLRQALGVTSVALLALPLAAEEPRSTAVEVGADDWSSIRAAYEAGRHAIVASDDGYRARTPGQAWTTQFDARAFTISPDGGGWSWGLELTHVGAADALIATGEPLGTTVDGQRLERRWSEALTEWYVNDTRGLEHGFTVHAPLAATATSGLLALDLAVRGDLAPRVSSNGRDVGFLAGDDRLVLNYAGLVAFDADGDRLAAHFESQGSTLRLVVDTRGADYPLTIDPIAQQAYLKASNTDAGDRFGQSVAIDGGTIVVGAPREDSGATSVNGDQSNDDVEDAGAAYVFVRVDSGWVQQAYLKASNAQSGDLFGYDVAISGDTVVVGAYEEDGNSNGVNGNQADNNAQSAGAAYIFVRNGTTWTQQAYVKASNSGTGDLFGVAVAIDRDTLVVGASHEAANVSGVNGNQNNNGKPFTGAAYVFERAGTVWQQTTYLKPSNATFSQYFGTDVDIDGDTLVVGAPWDESSSTGVDGDQLNDDAQWSGAAYVFVRSGGSWAQQAYVKASNTGTGDEFGSRVALDGDVLLVAALGEDSAAIGIGGDQNDENRSGAGAVYAFGRSSSVWSQQAYIKAPNTPFAVGFGSSIDVFENRAVVGATGDFSSATGVDGDPDNDGVALSGAAHVFDVVGSTWKQTHYLKAEHTDVFDSFGHSVGIGGDTIVVGALFEDSAATGVDGDAADDSAADAGAVTVFVGSDWVSVSGCVPHAASFVVPSVPVSIGTTTVVELVGGRVVDGLAATYYGRLELDAFGCGAALSPADELLLALVPFPTLLGIAPLVNGLAAQPIVVPDLPALVGVEVALQAALIDTLTFAGELSNAIEFEIRP